MQVAQIKSKKYLPCSTRLYSKLKPRQNVSSQAQALYSQLPYIWTQLYWHQVESVVRPLAELGDGRVIAGNISLHKVHYLLPNEKKKRVDLIIKKLYEI